MSPPRKQTRKAAKAPEAEPSELEQARAERDLAKAELEHYVQTNLAKRWIAPTPFQPGELTKTFGDNLRLARLELRMSQRELSNLSKVSQRHISVIEQGGNATLSTIEELAKHVNRSPFELLTPRPPRK